MFDEQMLKKKDWSLLPRRALTAPPKSSRGWRTARAGNSRGDGPDVAIEKTYTFANYYETISFVNAVAFIANAEDHHPDLSVHYNRCVVRFNTHDVKGMSETDFECAAQVDALACVRMRFLSRARGARQRTGGGKPRPPLRRRNAGGRAPDLPSARQEKPGRRRRPGALARLARRRHDREGANSGATSSTGRTRSAPSPSRPTSTRC